MRLHVQQTLDNPDKINAGIPVNMTVLAERVAVAAVDAEQPEVGLHRVAAAEGLMDDDGCASGQQLPVTAGDLRGGDFAGEDAVSVHARAFSGRGWR